MLEDYFRYYEDYESCQKVKVMQLVSASMLCPIIK
jgi:hypothetical protein